MSGYNKDNYKEKDLVLLKKHQELIFQQMKIHQDLLVGLHEHDH